MSMTSHMNLENKSDPVEMAIEEYYSGYLDTELIVNNNYGKPESYPVKYFFRNEYDMPDIEKYTLSLCRGRILDIGSGTGPHSLLLQRSGMDVTAIDNSQAMASVLLKNGIKKIICDDIFNFQCQNYDTAMLLMNGIGIVGTISMFQTFLKKMELVLHLDGQILFDSTDISYVYGSRAKKLGNKDYFGEVKFQFQYKLNKGAWFNWLYIDRNTLLDICKTTNWKVQIIFENNNGQYLSRLVRK